MPTEPVKQHAQTYQYDSLNELEQDQPYAAPSKPSPPRPMAKSKKVYEHPSEP